MGTVIFHFCGVTNVKTVCLIMSCTLNRGYQKMKSRTALLLLALSLFFLSGNVFALQFLKDFEGNIKSLEDYTGKGKWTIVMMWAHDCHVCNLEAGNYVAFHEKHKDRDAIMLGITMDGVELKKEAMDFIRRHKLNFDNLYGQPEEIAKSFQQLTGVQWFGTPTFLVFSPTGELMAQQVGAVPTNIIEDFIAKNP